MISLLIPTRGRPEGMRRVVNSAKEQASNPHCVEIVFYIDKSDADSIHMYNFLHENYPNTVKGIIGPEERTLSKLWNKCYDMATGPIYHHCGDDVVFRTKHWDIQVQNIFEQYDDRIVFVYGKDGIVDSDELGTHGFIHENWVKTVGYFVPPYFSADYNDTWLTDLAKKIERLHYDPELFIEHLHFSTGKSVIDETYKMRRAMRKADKNRSLFNNKEMERERDSEKLKKFIIEYTNV